MAPLHPVPQVIKFQIDWKIGTDTNAMTHLYWQYSGTAPSPATIITLAGDVLFALETRFATMFNPNVLCEGILATDLSDPAAAQGFTPASFAGTRAGLELPAATCCLVNGLIARRYRGGKPRFYWPFGVAADVQTGQTWTSAFVTAAQAAVNTFVQDVYAINASGTQMAQPVNVSYYSGTTQKLNGTTGRYYDVPIARPIPYIDKLLSQVVNPKFGSQRRRNQHSA